MGRKEKSILTKRIKSICVILGTGICLLSSFYTTAQESTEATVYKNVRVFDGERMIPSSTVVVQGEKISAIGTNIRPPEGSEIIDGEGLTLLPGFFDAHVHVWSPQNLHQSLIFGVTTVVDMFMDVKTMTDIKKHQSSGDAKDMAYLVSAGILATAPGGHGTQYGVAIPTLTGPEEARGFVEARIAEGSDFIKIIYDDGSAYGTSRPTVDAGIISALVEEAHQRGKMVIIHAATLQNCMEALEAGVDGLAHVYFNNASDPGFGRLAARKKVFVIPTLTVLESMHGLYDGLSLAEDPNLSPYITPNDLQMLKMTFPFDTQDGAYKAAERAVKQLMDQNVPVLAGTDAPNPGTTYGASLHRELELLVKAGLSNAEALRSATSIPAEIFGLKDRGLIHPGYAADLVLVSGDPMTDITATRNIKGVWKNGVKVDREKYRAAVEKEKKTVEQQKHVPPPPNSESGGISDFEGDTITAIFGAGWSVSTDSLIGGKSTAEYRLVEGGAQGSKGSLLITGKVLEGSQSRWAGAFFSPGPVMMSPANLSFKKSICFWAKGDGKTYSVMIFAQSLGFMPAVQTFTAGPEWQEFTFPFEKFSVEGYDIMGIFIGGSVDLGEFTLQIDDVCLK